MSCDNEQQEPAKVISPECEPLLARQDKRHTLTTSLQSTDSLPLIGYSAEQLIAYILRQLGAPTWNVEVTKQQAMDCVNDALLLYSQWRPQIRWAAIKFNRNVYYYLRGVDVGLGIIQVDFVESRPAPTEMFYGNLISPAPLLTRGIDDYDSFLRWRKTWLRVTSVQPDWVYDENERVLCIHNPIERYTGGVQMYFPYTFTQALDTFGAIWVKDYATAKARYIQGEIFAKFSGAIPGPAKDLALDPAKRDEANKQLEELRNKLIGAQQLTPISID